MKNRKPKKNPQRKERTRESEEDFGITERGKPPKAFEIRVMDLHTQDYTAARIATHLKAELESVKSAFRSLHYRSGKHSNIAVYRWLLKEGYMKMPID